MISTRQNAKCTAAAAVTAQSPAARGKHPQGSEVQRGEVRWSSAGVWPSICRNSFGQQRGQPLRERDKEAALVIAAINLLKQVIKKKSSAATASPMVPVPLCSK